MEKDFFVVDFEFTQYTKPVGKPRAFFPEIIEIGAVRIDGDTQEITGYIEDFVKPQFFPKQAAESMEFCMITASDMENAIDFSDMLQQIESLYIPGKTYFVSWGDADYSVVAQGCERYILPNPIMPEDYLDLAAAYKMLKGEKNTPGLQKAIEELNINADGFGHTAYDDAANTGKVLLKLISDGWKPEHYFAPGS
jgi:sporulation inhibitor KapD